MSEAKIAAIEAVDKLHKNINDHWNKVNYTKSIVAFVDVMGTKELILNNPDDFDTHKPIYKAWSEMENRQRLDECKFFFNEEYGDFIVKTTLMSDSVVLSIDANTPNAFSKLFMILGAFSHCLLSLKTPYFARGAVVIGNIYHDDNIVFGPALVKAHLMERDKAVNFRYIIDKNDFNEISNLMESDIKCLWEAFFYLDTDYYCFDYLYRYFNYADNCISTGSASSLYLSALARMQKKIKYEALNQKRIDVKSKYLWMEQYFNRTLNKVLKNSDTDEYLWLKKARSESGKTHE